MSVRALDDLLRTGSDHVVCFDEDATERRWPELKALAVGVSTMLAERGGDRWVIDIDDPFLFAASLIGVWGAGKTPIVSSPTLIHDADSGLVHDGIVVSGAFTTLPHVAVNLAAVEPGDPTASLTLPRDAGVVLFTSGSTGKPKEVIRGLRHMESEIFELDSLWMNDVPTCRFFSTASHRHVYGLLFRLLWPLMKSFPFAAFDLAYPEQLVRHFDEPDVLIASPALLKRLGHLDSGAYAWCRIFSSGGLLPLQAAVDCERVLGTCPIEVLGSTETSGVAWRRQAPAAPNLWHSLPSVAIRTDTEDFLEVKSPFSGTQNWQRMGDLAIIETATTFNLLGRGDHIAKIEDKRVSLSAIEQNLMRSPWIDDAAAVALERSGRQVVGAVVCLSSAGEAELEKSGRRELASSFRPLLESIETIAIPRFYRFVKRIPENAQGKRERRLLETLFE